MITFVHHPDDQAAVQRAYDELYPHEQERCQIHATTMTERGKLTVLSDPHDPRRAAMDRAVAWMREASEVYGSR